MGEQTMEDADGLGDLMTPTLGHGGRFALWGFRACAMGHRRSCTLVKGFERELGPFAEDALNGLLVLAQCLGTDGRRRVQIHGSGCLRATSDEVCVIAALSAAQMEHRSLFEAHVTWLLAGAPTHTAWVAAQQAASAFLSAGLFIQAPMLEITPPAPALAAMPMGVMVHKGGRA
ncbi:MAG: hypothetical protein ACFB6R_15460 [Alphaproteobacteria bacterium]